MPRDPDKKKVGSSLWLEIDCLLGQKVVICKRSFRDAAKHYETKPFSSLHRQTPEASHSVKDALDLSIDLSLLNCAAIPFGKNCDFIKDTEDYEIGSRCEVGLDSCIAVSFVEALLNKPSLMCSLLSCPV